MCDEPSYGQYAEWDGLCDEQVRVAGEEEYAALGPNLMWITRDGDHIQIKHMDDGHLLNTIRMLEGYSPHGTNIKMSPEWRRRFINAMCNEAYRRGLSLLATPNHQPPTTNQK